MSIGHSCLHADTLKYLPNVQCNIDKQLSAFSITNNDNVASWSRPRYSERFGSDSHRAFIRLRSPTGNCTSSKLFIELNQRSQYGYRTWTCLQPGWSQVSLPMSLGTIRFPETKYEQTLHILISSDTWLQSWTKLLTQTPSPLSNIDLESHAELTVLESAGWRWKTFVATLF